MHEIVANLREQVPKTRDADHCIGHCEQFPRRRGRVNIAISDRCHNCGRKEEGVLVVPQI